VRRELSELNEISSSKEVSNSICSKQKPLTFGIEKEGEQNSSDVEFCIESSMQNSSVPNSS
jgi:hypothetical protein